MPLLPATRLSKKFCEPTPTELTHPTPVTTTFFFSCVAASMQMFVAAALPAPRFAPCAARRPPRRCAPSAGAPAKASAPPAYTSTATAPSAACRRTIATGCILDGDRERYKAKLKT